MQTARRVLIIVLALIAACAVATVVVVVMSTFANPVFIGYRQVPGPDIYFTLQEWAYLTRPLFPAVSTVTVIPMLLLIIFISEVLQLRSFRFYAVSSVAVGAVWQVILLLMLALFWPGLADVSSGLRFLGWVEALAIAVTASAAAGRVYFTIAGRKAGRWTSVAVVSPGAESR